MATEPVEPGVGEFILYQTEDGRTRVECRFERETLWLPQAGMAELFQTTKQNVAKHLKTIFAEGELREDAVVSHWLTTAADGKRYRVAHYNLDAILAVGYRVRSVRGTLFRRWATERLNDREVLPNAGSISKKQADARARAHFERFAADRRARLEDEGSAANVAALIDVARQREGTRGPGGEEF